MDKYKNINLATEKDFWWQIINALKALAKNEFIVLVNDANTHQRCVFKFGKDERVGEKIIDAIKKMCYDKINKYGSTLKCSTKDISSELIEVNSINEFVDVCARIIDIIETVEEQKCAEEKEKLFLSCLAASSDLDCIVFNETLKNEITDEIKKIWQK